MVCSCFLYSLRRICSFSKRMIYSWRILKISSNPERPCVIHSIQDLTAHYWYIFSTRGSIVGQSKILQHRIKMTWLLCSEIFRLYVLCCMPVCALSHNTVRAKHLLFDAVADVLSVNVEKRHCWKTCLYHFFAAPGHIQHEKNICTRVLTFHGELVQLVEKIRHDESITAGLPRLEIVYPVHEVGAGLVHAWYILHHSLGPELCLDQGARPAPVLVLTVGDKKKHACL